MSKVTLQIIAEVVNKATKPLADVETGLKKTGAAAKKAQIDFVGLNRVLFSTKAFFGIFSNLFNNFKKDMTEAANLQRVENSFKNTFGQNSDIIASLDKFSSIGVDRIAAMKDAIALGMMGIAKSSDQAAQILAGAAFGAKQAGVDTTEAMSKITQSLKDGSLSGLEYLNMIRSSDPLLKAQLELLHKYSGSIGGAVTSQAKLNLIMSITNRLSQLAKGNQEDLLDSIIKLENSFSKLRQTVGDFLGKAFGGFLQNLTKGVNTLSDFLEVNTKGDKGLVHLAKSMMSVTAAAAAMYAGFYSLKIISSILTAAGVGLPFLQLGLFGLVSAFTLTTNKAASFTDKLKVFGNLVEGITQLINNLDSQTGLSKIDKDIKEILQRNGIWTLAQNIARGASVIISVFNQMRKAFDDFEDGFMSGITPIANTFKKLFGFNAGPWSKSLVDGTSAVTKGLGKGLAVAGLLYLAIKSIRGVRGFLGNIPFLGKMFGGGKGGPSGKGPSGNASDPIYTKQVGLGGLVEVAKGLSPGRLFSTLKGILFSGGLNKTGKTSLELITKSVSRLGGEGVTPSSSPLVNSLRILTDIFTLIPNMFNLMFNGLTGMLGLATNLVAIAGAGAVGYGVGTLINKATKGTAFDRFVDKAADIVGGVFGVEGTSAQQKEVAIKNASTDFMMRKGTAPTAAVTPQQQAMIGLNKQHKVAYMPAIPSTLEGQLNLLKSTKAMVEPKEKDIFVKALQDMTAAMYRNADPKVTAKITEEAYVKAIHRTKEPNHTANKPKRGGC